MKTNFRSLYLSIILTTCGLVFLIYIGCGSDESEEDIQAESVATYDSTLSSLNPTNGAAYDDIFFKEYGTNPFIDTEDEHLSTFGMDVDTASYSVTRRYLRDGHLPPSEAVRVEEFVNTFDSIAANRYPGSHHSRRKQERRYINFCD